MLSEDRLVCAFVKLIETSHQFREWPLHVTIVPWFRSPDSSGAIAGEIQQILKSIAPFEAAGDGEGGFGQARTGPVRLLKKPTPFTDIEARIRGYLHKKHAWLVDETTKVRHEFRPHVTAQKSAQLHEGDTFWCDRLYIVEQKGGYKEVTARIQLGDD